MWSRSWLDFFFLTGMSPKILHHLVFHVVLLSAPYFHSSCYPIFFSRQNTPSTVSSNFWNVLTSNVQQSKKYFSPVSLLVQVQIFFLHDIILPDLWFWEIHKVDYIKPKPKLNVSRPEYPTWLCRRKEKSLRLNCFDSIFPQECELLAVWFSSSLPSYTKLRLPADDCEPNIRPVLFIYGQENTLGDTSYCIYCI